MKQIKINKALLIEQLDEDEIFRIINSTIDDLEEIEDFELITGTKLLEWGRDKEWSCKYWLDNETITPEITIDKKTYILLSKNDCLPFIILKDEFWAAYKELS